MLFNPRSARIYELSHLPDCPDDLFQVVRFLRRQAPILIPGSKLDQKLSEEFLP